MDRDLRIQILFGALDKLSAPLRQLQAGSKGLSKALAETQSEAAGLKKAQAQIAQYRGAEERMKSQAAELEKVRAKTAALREEIAKVEAPTRKMTRELERAERAERGATDAHEAQGRKLQELGSRLDGAGIDVAELGRHEERLGDQLRDTNRQIDKQREQLDRLKRARERGEALQRSGTSIAGAGTALTLGVTAPAVAAGFASGREFIGFEDAMANISTLIDENLESMAKMRGEVLALSERAPVGLEDLTEALYDIRSAGTPAAKAMGVLENSAKLAVAGIGTTAEAADIATSAINAFGLKGVEADRVYDNVFKTVKAGKTTISQLSQGFGGVAGTVANAGIKFDEYLASVAALTTTGLPAAQAHTQIRAAIAGLTRETEQSRKVFRALGAKDLKDLIAKSGGLVPALARIKEELGGNDAAMLQLFGSTEALNAAIALTGKQGGAYADALRDMREGQDALDPAFAKKMETDAAQLKVGMNQLKVGAIGIGAIVIPHFVALAKHVAAAAQWFGQLDPAIQSNIVAAIAIAAALGPVLTLVGNITRAVGFLWPALTKLGGVLKLLGPLLSVLARGVMLFATVIARAGLMLLANPMVLAIVAIIAVVGLLAYAIYSNWDRIKAAFSSGVAFLGTALAAIGKAFSAAVSWLGGLWSSFASIGANLLKGLVQGMMGALGWVKDKIVGVGKSVVGWFKKTLGINSPSRVFMGLGGHIMEGLSNGLDRGAAAPIARIRKAGSDLTKTLAASSLVAAPVATAGPFSGAGAAAPSRQAAAPTPAGGSREYHFHIAQRPGESTEDLAKRIAEEIEKRERAAEARRGSSYEDEDL